jgi:tetraprenyl-beta-curcumene synthase
VHHRLYRQLRLAIAFALTAYRYWLGVFPIIRGERQRLQARARRIPVTELRELALQNLATESANLEGAAAFAAFLPAVRRQHVVRAQVAFQAAYDYVDSLSEQPDAISAINTRRLHCALMLAVTPKAPHLDYYAHHTSSSDGGYLVDLVDACRCALEHLPSYSLVAGAVRRNVRRIVGYQTRTNLPTEHGRLALESWAQRETPPETNLRWWETGAACGSSMAVLALLAAAADPQLRPSAVHRIEAAYWPWTGALHSLLDSLIDRNDDALTPQHSLISHYASPQQMTVRLRAIATEAARGAKRAGEEHSLILTGMASLYLSDPRAWSPDARPSTTGVLGALGTYTVPALLILGARRATSHRNRKCAHS